jgi:hypothetical protein
MRDLSIHEFEQVQGGTVASRILGNASNLITFVSGVCEAYLFLVEKESPPNFDNYDQLGNYTGDMTKG